MCFKVYYKYEMELFKKKQKQFLKSGLSLSRPAASPFG